MTGELPPPPKRRKWLVWFAAASVKQLDDGFYAMKYTGSYGLEDFLEQNGASSDLAVTDFIIQRMFHGMVDLKLQGSSFGCSTLSVASPSGERLFGRNFDWGACTAMVVETSPPGERYGIGTAESHTRYELLTERLGQTAVMEPDDVRDALDRVSKHNFDSVFASTEWSTVYNQTTGAVQYYHREDYTKPYNFVVE